MYMGYKLFLDDIRDPPHTDWVVVRSSANALYIVRESGELPVAVSLDHDLGGEDNAMVFLKGLYDIWESVNGKWIDIPGYIVHSANPVGSQNIVSFMESWKKSALMP
jgi:hypothetical protein